MLAFYDEHRLLVAACWTHRPVYPLHPKCDGNTHALAYCACIIFSFTALHPPSNQQTSLLVISMVIFSPAIVLSILVTLQWRHLNCGLLLTVVPT